MTLGAGLFRYLCTRSEPRRPSAVAVAVNVHVNDHVYDNASASRPSNRSARARGRNFATDRSEPLRRGTR
jgi:hypothetical protein